MNHATPPPSGQPEPGDLLAGAFTARALRRARAGLYAGAGVLALLVVAGPLGDVVAAAIDPPEATVRGVVFVDSNGNDTFDEGEQPLGGVSVSDGTAMVTSGADGRYELTVDTDRRHTDLVFIRQPSGFVVPTDEHMQPRFYRELGELADDEIASADFAVLADDSLGSDQFTFANVADPHVNAQLADQVREINSTSQDLAFIQVSGDLTNDASIGQFDTYLRATAGSDVPVWPAVGNHEYFGGGGTTYADRIDNYRTKVGPEWYSFDYGDRHFLVLENNGQAPFDEQLRWVEQDLVAAMADQAELVVLAHQPMNVPFGSPSTYDAYGDVLEKYGAQLVLVGHEHSNHVENDSTFVRGAKHIQTVSSSYTIDNAPRGFRYVHVHGKGFDNPFRMYGQDEDLTIVSPAPGSAVPAKGFPGVQVNAYDTADQVRSVQMRVDGGEWTDLHSTGEFTWFRQLPGRKDPGEHTLEVRAQADGGGTWTERAGFTLTADKAIQVEAGSDWSQHHGDASHAGVAPAQEPGRRLAWSYRTEGTFLTGSPVVVGNVLYAGTRDENGEGNSRLHAVDVITGKKLWDREVPQSIHGSLAAADGLVFVPTLEAALYAFDGTTGELVWKHAPEAAPAPYNQRAYGYYSPAVADGKVLWPYQTRYGAGSAGVLKALDTRTGEPVWQAALSGNQMSDGTPAVADGMVYVGTQTADRVVALDLQTGARRWLGAESLGGWQDGIPTAAGGRVFIGSNNGIVARDGATGELLWSFRSPYPSLVSSGATPSAAAVRDDVVYMAFPSGAVTALDARTGAVIWDRLLPGTVYEGGVASSPVVAGDSLFVGSNNGRFYALDVATGQPLWQHEIGTWVAAGPVVAGNLVVAGAWDGNLYAYAPGGPAAAPWARLTGTVADPETGAPVDGARITATPVGPGTAVSTSAGADGEYVLGLAAGKYRISAAKAGYLAADSSIAEVTVGDSGSTTADLALLRVTHPVAGLTTVPPSYGSASTRTDVVAGDRYGYVMNDKVRAHVVTRTAANNAAGVFRPGALADIMQNDAAATETLDWSELVLARTMNDPARPWNRSGEWLDLPLLTVDGSAVVASGDAQVDRNLKTSIRYETLPGAPVVKMTLTVANTGTSDFAGYFHYLLDPDSSQDVARIPGVSGTDPGFRTSGWTKDYVYTGASQPNGQPAQGIAWAQDEPTGVSAFGYIVGAWFDASVRAGGSRDVTWYHVTDQAAAGADPTANIARWVDRIELLDPAVPDLPRAGGTVTGTDDKPLAGVRVVMTDASGQVAATTTSAADGTFESRLEPGAYTLRATRLGLASATAQVQVDASGTAVVDLTMEPVRVEAGTGKRLAGSVELGVDDLVLENEKLAVGLSVGFDDPQLAGATKGKPIDVHPAGRTDQIDWINLPYVSATEPTGTEAWQVPTVQPASVEVVESSTERAVVRAKGPVSGMPGLTATTTYTLLPDEDRVTASTELRNAGSGSVHVWAGDAIDWDGAGQRAGIAGVGDVVTPYAEPAAYMPSGRWIGMSGTDPQVVGLVYGEASGAFSAYGNGNWVMSRFEVTIPAGGTWTLDRKLVVAPVTGSDEWAPLATAAGS